MILDKISGWSRSLYDWVVHWAKTRYAQRALFGIAVMESSFFPVPPDVLLIAMGVSDSKKALRFAFICTAGSVLGGALGYYIGYELWKNFSDFFFAYIPGFKPEMFQVVIDKFQANAWISIFAASFTPIPYKIFTIASGVAEVPLWTFLSASIVGRGMRFLIIGACLKMFGPSIQNLIEKYFNWLAIAFTVLVIGGFVAIKLL